MNPLRRNFYSHLQLVPRVVATNVIRVIMSVMALNKITGSEMGLKEILHYYTVHRTPKGVYYFKKRAHKEELIEYLPDSERGDDDDYFVVSGNWQYAPGDGGLYEIPRSSSAPNCTASFCMAQICPLFFFLFPFSDQPCPNLACFFLLQCPGSTRNLAPQTLAAIPKLTEQPSSVALTGDQSLGCVTNCLDTPPDTLATVAKSGPAQVLQTRPSSRQFLPVSPYH